MAKPKHIILTEEGVITQEALQAYAQGALSSEEVVQVEKLLREDPFAQEALDGIRQNAAAASMSSAVSAINTRLREKAGLREKKNKGIQIHWATYAYAATIVGVLIGLGFVMVHFMQQNNNPAIAMNNETPQAEESMAQPEQKPEQSVPITDTAQTAKIPDQTPLTADTAVVRLNPGSGAVNAASPTTFTSTTFGATQNAAPPIAQAKTPATASASGYNNSNADKKANLQQVTTTAAAKPAATPTRKEEEVAITVDGHDLATGAEAKARNYKNVTTADLEASKISAKVSKAEAKKEKANATAADQMKEARSLFDAGDFKEAAKRYDKVLSDQPDNMDALFFGGICEYKNGKLKPAEKNFDKLIKSGQYVDGSKWYKANVLIDRGKKDEARVLLKELSVTANPYKDRAVKKFEEVQK